MGVVIADDAMLMREGTARLLGDVGFEVVGKVDDAQKLIRTVALEHPDVAIVDIKMPPTFTDEGSSPRRRSGTPIRTWACRSSPNTWKRETPCASSSTTPGGVGYLLKERVSDVAVLVARLVNRPRRHSLLGLICLGGAARSS